MVGTPKTPPSKHKTFGISDSLLDAVKEVYRPKDKEDAKEAYIRPGMKQRERDQARKSDTLKSKDSVSSAGTTAFKKKHAGKTVPKRAAGAPVPKSTGAKGDKRPVGGMGAVHYDLGNMPEDEFRRKHGKSKSAMRTGLRDHVEVQKEENDMTFRQSDYEYNKDSWMKSLRQVGKDGIQEEELKEMNITVEMNPGGTTYKVISVSKDIGGRIKVGENLTDTHIDDLRDSDVSISYRGGKDGKGKMKKMEAKEAKDVDAKNAAAARTHDCASHVTSEEFGEGVCIPTQHAEPNDEGHVEWYDVMFDHGIERVMTEKVAVVKSSSHGNHMSSSKMKKKKAIMGSKMEEKDVMKHNCATHVKHEEFGEGNPIPGAHTLEETSEGEGVVTHYDVMFEDGIKENIPVEELEIIAESMHAHVDKKKMMKKKGQKPIMSYMKMGEAKDVMKHNCATHVKHEQYGEGECIPGEHTLEKIAEGYGIVTHYDVMFEDGIKENVPVEDLEILKEMSHGHAKKKSKKEAMDPVGQADADIDNDGDTDDSDEYLHKRRKAIKKAMKKESVNENFTAPGKEQPKDAAQAYALAEHYWQMSNRDALYGREDKQKVNEGLAKQFYDIYKQKVADGDESAVDTFKSEEVIAKLESFSESETTQTTEEDYQSTMKGHMKDQNKKDKAAGMVKLRKDGDGIHTVTVKQADVQAYMAKGYKRVPIGESFDSTNMPEHEPEIVELTPSAYDYNRSSWRNALAEVNRYKTGGTGHRVTQPDKSGDEHIVMQLRKAVSVGANHSGVKFKDGSTHKVSPKTAQKHLDHYNKLKPEEKIKWQNSAAHSHGGLSAASSEKKLGQAKPAASKGRDEPTRRLINPMDRD